MNDCCKKQHYYYYLKVQNDGPDQPQGQFWVSICDVIIPDIYKFDLMRGKKAQLS